MVQAKIRGDTSVKTRKLIRKHGWTPVDVNLLEISWVNLHNETIGMEDKDKFLSIVEWCNNTVGKENYLAVLHNCQYTQYVQRFVFKNPKHATLFRLAWPI